jgi:hypothetical protein
LADGTEVPLLPRIPAPIPPPQHQELYEEDPNGLYEEIEYEFELKKNGKEEIIPNGYRFERNSHERLVRGIKMRV